MTTSVLQTRYLFFISQSNYTCVTEFWCSAFMSINFISWNMYRNADILTKVRGVGQLNRIFLLYPSSYHLTDSWEKFRIASTLRFLYSFWRFWDGCPLGLVCVVRTLIVPRAGGRLVDVRTGWSGLIGRHLRERDVLVCVLPC